MNRIRIPDMGRFEASVEELEQKPLETGKILFYGDSGFTRWSLKYGNRPLEEELPGRNGELAVLNHGLGGSTTEELLYYYPRAVKPWKPKALVFMTYLNDIGFGYSPEDVLDLQSRIFAYARQDVPGIRILACDVRPTAKHLDDPVAMRGVLSKCLEYNELLENYCAKHSDVTLVRHITSPLFFEDPADVGDYLKIRRDIFVEDAVHFNQQGYDLYREFFLTELADLL